MKLSEDLFCELLRTRSSKQERFINDKEFSQFIIEGLKDIRPRVRRYAAIAAGRENWGVSSLMQTLETALLEAWHSTELDNERRLIAESLGKIGGEKSFELLSSVKTLDPLLFKALTKAKLIFERRMSQVHKTQWQWDNVFPSPLPVRLWCRRGLESLLVRQFDSFTQEIEISKVGPAWVDILLKSKVSLLFKNRIFLNFGFPLPLKNPYALKNPKIISEALFQKSTRQILATFSSPPFRMRLEHSKGGHQRSLQWKTAEEIHNLAQQSGFKIINDPRQADWEAVISASEAQIFLCPKSYEDPRFNYRMTDVPAASHPTIASALAYVANVKQNDRVWDPFVGSGSELIESYRYHVCTCIGTDRDEKALTGASINLKAAGVENFILEKADALSYQPKELCTLIITNPPMGRRVPVKDIQTLLIKFVQRLDEVLSSNGRFVWMSPFPLVLDKELSKMNFRKTYASKVDMGGFSAELQRWDRNLTSLIKK